VSARSRPAKDAPGASFEQILSYPAHVTIFGHPDDPPPGFKVVRLWRFADTDLRPASVMDGGKRPEPGLASGR
jgi:hypothetical protein